LGGGRPGQWLANPCPDRKTRRGSEKRGALEGWEATPHQQLERLLRETGVPTGLLLTDGELRVIQAPRGETSGWLKFPIRSLCEVGGRPMLGGLKLILSSFRLHNDAPDRRLASLLKASRDAQAEVSTRLAAQVLGALHELLRGLHSADRARTEALAASRPEHLYEGLLTVLLRLVFLLYAEDRNLIPSRTDGEARALYDQGYGVRSLYMCLLDDAALHPDTMDERRGAWSRLLALFRLVHRGDGRGWIRGRGGKLFDPEGFPFLQGQDSPSDQPSPATLSDGCVLRILDLLLSLDGERLSYRTLDVEQIGSVYETVMGFTVETRPGPALAIRAGKNDRTPVFVDVAALTAKKGAERAKFLKEEADRNALTDKVGKALATATDAGSVIAALLPIVDERGSPGGHVVLAGTPLLQPTDERRRTGSHYTPRSLTGPIVQHALEPAFARLGPDAKPEAILDLKVCDPAMGSGAFLVEACRALGERLVQAWAQWPETRPTIPSDEDEHLHARRLVAQRCLYGVDKNPRAVDLARLSLWLATLARDHEFTFLDHALKCGDSLVGLTTAQIAATHWDTSRAGLPLFRRLVKERVAEAMKGRAEIQAAPDDPVRAIQEARHLSLETRLREIRLIGDAVIAALFSTDKPKAREKKRAEVESWLTGSLEAAWGKLVATATTLKWGANFSLTPFHWEIEFPEVFSENSGFDAIVGNPPFLGGKSISTNFGNPYSHWLETCHPGGTRSADLVAHFFRRAFSLVRPGGVFGLIATNTIGQGDTRDTGLANILENDGAIIRAVRRLKWPGEAAVVVSVVHVAKHQTNAQPILDGRPVSRVSAYLVEGELDHSPTQLVANNRIAFVGSFVLGMGFTFDNKAAAVGAASSLGDMRQLAEKNARNAEIIFPYLGGEEISTDPYHKHHRYAIDFFDRPLGRRSDLRSWKQMTASEQAECLTSGLVPVDYPDEVAEDWPDLLEIIRRMVKPERDVQKRKALRERWWQYADKRPGLYNAIRALPSVLVTGAAAVMHHMVASLPSNLVFSHKTIVFALATRSSFACLQSSIHELWSRSFGTTFGSVDALTYNPTQVFRTFPFPPNFKSDIRLEAAGSVYHDHRAALMIARNEGMTKTYNRYHDQTETVDDIKRLRELHTAMDRAVLEAYGWHDLVARAEPIFLNEAKEENQIYQGRLFWTSDFRDEIIARLLALNAERAAAERLTGIGGIPEDEHDEIEEEIDA
jgi:hypothetical protein